MQIHRNEITTGLLVILTFGLLFIVLAIVGLPGLLRPLNIYHIYYDNAKGIRPGGMVLLGGRQIGKVKSLQSPVPVYERPVGHPDYEVSIDVEVDRSAQVYRSVTVLLTQQGLLGQEVIDFQHGDETSGLAPNHAEFVGERVPDISESVADNMKRLTGKGSDLSLILKNTREITDKLNKPDIAKVVKNVEQMTDTLKRQPWRLIWPATKIYPEEKPPKAEKAD